MPEHVHLLIFPKKEYYLIAKIVQSIKQSVSRKALLYLRKHNPAGLRLLVTGQKWTPYRFWQDGCGFDRNVTKSKALKNMVNYIHNNPVRRGLVDKPEDWKWSSYLGWKEEGIGLIEINKSSFPAL